MSRAWAGDRARLISNTGARVGALASLGVATVLVAHSAGPSQVGLLTLLRVLPGLAGVLVSCGLPTAIPYFLSSRGDPALRSTIVALTALCAAIAGVAWALGSPVLQAAFFREQDVALVAWCGVAVFTQLLVAVGKAMLQGSDDLRGADAAIVAEEAAFLPTYLVSMPFLHGGRQLVVALIAADLLVAVGIWQRLSRQGLLGPRRRPNRQLAGEVLRFGVRGQVGGVLLLLNLRLDFALLAAMAGPAVLGIYAIASKYAELLRLPGLALTYVLYPRFARQGRQVARRRTRELLARSTGITALLAVPLALAAGRLLPMLYGADFADAVLPAWILVAGLATEGAAGLVTAYLYATGRPGLSSLAIGGGVLVTAVLDVLLIPQHGAAGAALASTVAYLTTTLALLVMFTATRRPDGVADDAPDDLPDDVSNDLPDDVSNDLPDDVSNDPRDDVSHEVDDDGSVEIVSPGRDSRAGLTVETR